MSEEIHKLTSLGIIMCLLAVVISIALTVFSSGKGLTNTGSANTVDAIQSAQDSKYDIYDGTTITGLQVKSGINNMLAEDKVVLLHTYSMETNGMLKEVPDKIYGVQLNDLTYINIGKILGDSEQLEFKDNKLDKDFTFKKSELKEDGRFVYTNTDLTSESMTQIKQLNEEKGLMAVPDAAKFKSVLIKDALGNICGVAFTQEIKK